MSTDSVLNERECVLGDSCGINIGFHSQADHNFFKDLGGNWDPKVVNQPYDWVLSCQQAPLRPYKEVSA